MVKVKCIRSVSFGATGDVYDEGESYDVTAKLASDYPRNFEKKKTTTKNKKVETEENK